ncbi:MerR family transcriptional regulator [Bdellovibrio sp. KM01]|uniref:MerR family transcriptional regulator n=1 Tax=Bdellovibrio sp. KM01 TaxID=2748865 RepID=UPI0015E940DC|nr:MerR family transcriptional regulator [Bdellovibrio sp. KM01]QLY26414.1 MerR family transcriptional regulator [Bdellovibrio sp. KM01]
MAKIEVFSIRQVIELTGISEFTLRGWETRYKAFKPKRSATGRRIYSRQDIQKARLLQTLLDKGYKIGNIAKLSLTDLEKILPQQEAVSSTLTPSPENLNFVNEAMDLAHLFKWDVLSENLHKTRSKMKPVAFVTDILTPLAGQMGYLVGAGQLSVGQEHILSAFIKEQLILIQSAKKNAKSKARLIMTTPDGDLHDMGIAFASSLSRLEKIQTLFLGPSTPKIDLSETCLRYNATHLLISSTVSEEEGAKESLFSYINFLDRNLPGNVVFLLAGRNTMQTDLNLKRPLVTFRSMSEYHAYLKDLS